MLPNDPKLIDFLNRLFNSNADFRRFYNDEFFQQFEDQQTPLFTLLKCSDSRIQIQSFESNPQNNAFVIRNIGNQIANSEGSVDFGVQVLKTPFLLIIGHSGCGAIKSVISGQKTKIPAIDKELESLKFSSNHTKEAIIENINNQVDFAMNKYSSKVKKSELTIIGAIYDFRDDFALGKGKLILVNINGINDSGFIDKQYSKIIKNLQVL